MALIKSDKKEKEISVSAKFPESLKNEMEKYIKFAELNSMNEFLVKAVEFVLSKDKEWKKSKLNSKNK